MGQNQALPSRIPAPVPGYPHAQTITKHLLSVNLNEIASPLRVRNDSFFDSMKEGSSLLIAFFVISIPCPTVGLGGFEHEMVQKLRDFCIPAHDIPETFAGLFQGRG